MTLSREAEEGEPTRPPYIPEGVPWAYVTDGLGRKVGAWVAPRDAGMPANVVAMFDPDEPSCPFYWRAGDGANGFGVGYPPCSSAAAPQCAALLRGEIGWGHKKDSGRSDVRGSPSQGGVQPAAGQAENPVAAGSAISAGPSGPPAFDASGLGGMFADDGDEDGDDRTSDAPAPSGELEEDEFLLSGRPIKMRVVEVGDAFTLETVVAGDEWYDNFWSRELLTTEAEENSDDPLGWPRALAYFVKHCRKEEKEHAQGELQRVAHIGAEHGHASGRGAESERSGGAIGDNRGGDSVSAEPGRGEVDGSGAVEVHERKLDMTALRRAASEARTELGKLQPWEREAIEVVSRAAASPEARNALGVAANVAPSPADGPAKVFGREPETGETEQGDSCWWVTFGAFQILGHENDVPPVQLVQVLSIGDGEAVAKAALRDILSLIPAEQVVEAIGDETRQGILAALLRASTGPGYWEQLENQRDEALTRAEKAEADWDSLLARASKAEMERDVAIGERNEAIGRADASEILRQGDKEEIESLAEDLVAMSKLRGRAIREREQAERERDEARSELDRCKAFCRERIQKIHQWERWADLSPRGINVDAPRAETSKAVTYNG